MWEIFRETGQLPLQLPPRATVLSDFSGGIDELVYSVYLSSELIVIDTQTVDGPGVL